MSAQVTIIEESFNYSDLTFDITLQNEGIQEVVLTNIGANYRIYIHLVWMGQVRTPSLKPAAHYQLPVYIARACYDSTYLVKEKSFEYGTGIWDCANTMSAEPELYVKPQSKTKLQIQLRPYGFKSYWEMDLDINLILTFNDQKSLNGSRFKIFSQDITAAYFGDRILNKNKVLSKLAVTSEEAHEELDLSERRGKEGYVFGKPEAVLHLDKFDLTPDSIELLLAQMLHDEDPMVRARACMLIRKHKYTNLTDSLVLSWKQAPFRERDYLENEELLYALVSLDKKEYIDSTLLQLTNGFFDFRDFKHLLNRHDDLLYERVNYCIKNNRNILLKMDTSDYQIEKNIYDIYSYWAGKLELENIPELRFYLKHETNIKTLDGVINGLVAGETDFFTRKSYLAHFKEEFADLTSQSNLSINRENFEVLQLYIEENPDLLERRLLKTLADSDINWSPAIWDMVDSVQQKLQVYPRFSSHWLWKMSEFSIQGKIDSIISLTEWLAQPLNLMQLRPEQLRLLYTFFSRQDFDRPDSISSLFINKTQIIKSVMANPDYWRKVELIDLAQLVTFMNYSDSLYIDILGQEVFSRIKVGYWKKLTQPELKKLIIIAKEASRILGNDLNHRILWYHSIELFYDQLLNNDEDKEIRQEVSNFYYDHAYFFLQNKKPVEAIKACQRGIELLDQQSLYSMLGIAYIMDGQFDRAKKLYQTLKDTPILESRFGQDETLKKTFIDDIKAFERRGSFSEIYKKEIEEVKKILNQ